MSLSDDLRKAADAGQTFSRSLLLGAADELDRLSGRSSDAARRGWWTNSALVRVTAERDALRAELDATRAELWALEPEASS